MVFAGGRKIASWLCQLAYAVSIRVDVLGNAADCSASSRADCSGRSSLSCLICVHSALYPRVPPVVLPECSVEFPLRRLRIHRAWPEDRKQKHGICLFDRAIGSNLNTAGGVAALCQMNMGHMTALVLEGAAKWCGARGCDRPWLAFGGLH